MWMCVLRIQTGVDVCVEYTQECVSHVDVCVEYTQECVSHVDVCVEYTQECVSHVDVRVEDTDRSGCVRGGHRQECVYKHIYINAILSVNNWQLIVIVEMTTSTSGHFVSVFLYQLLNSLKTDDQ